MIALFFGGETKDKFVIQGEIPLSGSVRASGAKNATLPLMAAALLPSGISVLHDVPDLRDIRVMETILRLSEEIGSAMSRYSSTEFGAPKR